MSLISTDAATDFSHLSQWIGRTRQVGDDLRPFSARALAAALETRSSISVGDEMPPAWHWLYFLEMPSKSRTGADGHPALGDFMPPVALPRRMWAAGNFEVLAPLTLGSLASRKSVIKSVDAKAGRSGALVFVTLEHEVTQDDRVCIREVQNLVYRDMPMSAAPLPPGERKAADEQFSQLFRPDVVLLFRYSALTYNSHRIHYDLPYATECEFYPGLVVHGPLLATALLDLLQNNLPTSRVVRFEFRALRPSFHTSAILLCGRRDDDRVSLWTTDELGYVGMRAMANIA